MTKPPEGNVDANRTVSDRFAYRQFKVTNRRPDPPRELGFIGNLLTWKPPQDDRNVTHYRVRIDTDYGDPDYEVSAGQKSLLLSQGTRFYVSSWNSVARLESKRACIEGSFDDTGQRIVASFNVPGELETATDVTNPIEFSLDDGYVFRCRSVWWNVDEAATSDTYADLLWATDETKTTYTSILDADGAVGNVRVSAGGSGYAAGDEITLVQAGGSGATLRVETAGDPTGDVQTFEITAAGTGYQTADAIASTTDGGGIGATFDIDVGEVRLKAGELQLPAEYRVFKGYPEDLDLERRGFLRLDIAGSTSFPQDALVQLVGRYIKQRVARGGRSTATNDGTRIDTGG